MIRRSAAFISKMCVVCGKQFLCRRSDAICCSGACRALKFKHGVPVSGPRPRLPRFQLYEPFTFIA